MYGEKIANFNLSTPTKWGIIPIYCCRIPHSMNSNGALRHVIHVCAYVSYIIESGHCRITYIMRHNGYVQLGNIPVVMAN